MDTELTTLELDLEPEDTNRLAQLCGACDAHIKQMESHLNVTIHNRGHHFQISGNAEQAHIAQKLLIDLYSQSQSNAIITPDDVHLLLREELSIDSTQHHTPSETLSIQTPRVKIRPRGEKQCEYVSNIQRYDISFGIGPAGTGKTYLAVACAVEALERNDVRRILLVRPAVEAGEKLGFLPGDLAEKVNPYLRPLYDALYDMLGFERVERLIDRHVIEVAPLAYMRGRTLNHAFVILDESQNTTPEQMKMLLTRLGFGSKAVITGDVTQIDLPKGTQSGLAHASTILQNVEGIAQTRFSSKDVVRHTLVQRIVDAYDSHR